MTFKSFLALGLTTVALSITTAYAAPLTQVSGEVLEAKDVEVYTYLRLKTKEGETWAAVNKAPIKKGDKVTVDNVTMMTNFESKTLKKTFPSIAFGTLAGAATAMPSASGAAADPHAGLPKAPDMAPVKVAKATGANAYTVAEVLGKADALKDKPVRIQGKVVKYNADIMGKNWLHLRDGSGTAASSTDDLLVTTSATAKLGDVVTVSGVVHTNKDFGAGYSYKVLVEDASLKP